MFETGEAIRKLALNLARYTGLGPLARPFVGGIGAILMLHRVTANPAWPTGPNKHLTVDPEFLGELIGDMIARGYQFVTLDEVVKRIGANDGGRFATITADDGYRDNMLEALPVLERHNTPITIYVAPAQIDRKALLWWEVAEDVVQQNSSISFSHNGQVSQFDCSSQKHKNAAFTRLEEMFNGVIAEHERDVVLAELAQRNNVDPLAPNRTLLDWAELNDISRHPLVTIGAHTVNHYSLRRLSEDAAQSEITNAADIIEARIGLRPKHLAYPYGYARAVGPREVELARRAGYLSAVTTRHGLLQAEHINHLQALPRLSVNGRYQKLAHFRTMLTGVTTPLANSGKTLVTV